MRNYTTVLNGQRRSFRLRPFEECWDVKMVNGGQGQATINILVREAPDKPAHVLLCQPIAALATKGPSVPVWSKIVDYQTRNWLVDFELLETDATVRLEFVLGN